MSTIAVVVWRLFLPRNGRHTYRSLLDETGAPIGVSAEADEAQQCGDDNERVRSEQAEGEAGSQLEGGSDGHQAGTATMFGALTCNAQTASTVGTNGNCSLFLASPPTKVPTTFSRKKTGPSIVGLLKAPRRSYDSVAKAGQERDRNRSDAAACSCNEGVAAVGNNATAFKGEN